MDVFLHIKNLSNKVYYRYEYAYAHFIVVRCKVGNSADKKMDPSPVQSTISIIKQLRLIKSLTSFFSLDILVSALADNICRNHSHL